MPELPDLEYIVSVLNGALRGRRILQVRVKNPIVLRLGLAGTVQELCAGRAFGGGARATAVSSSRWARPTSSW